MADTAPTFSERLWSEEVGRANADAPPPRKDPAYEWSNGRVFEEGPGASQPTVP